MYHIVLGGTVRDALFMKLCQMGYHLPDKILQLPSNPVVELRELKTY
jgi:hypothetical protein